MRESETMELTEAISKLVDSYGLPGIIIAALIYLCNALWTAFQQEVKKNSENGVTIALAMERNTQAIESLKDLIRERK